jgi:hypothetical protein
VAALVVGALLLGTAAIVSASGSSGETGCTNAACTITLSSDTGLSFATPVSVHGTHFTAGRGAIVECNMAPNEPTIAVTNNRAVHLKNFGSLPVGCTPPARAPVRVAKNGTFSSGIGIDTNDIGPPSTGTDSAGGSASADAANYPCPPTEAQFNAGVSCAIVFQDTVDTGTGVRHETAFHDISFSSGFSTTTTATTTTIAGQCTAVPTEGSAMNAGTGTVASAAVNPGSCLSSGQGVAVTAVGLVPSSTGSLLECNSDPSQPTVSDLGATIGVGCSAPVVFSTTTAGGVPAASQHFVIVEGTVGPPLSTTDSSGGSSTADAAAYPCPPTPAQVSAGDTCAIRVGDAGGDQVVVPLWFLGGSP